MSKLMNVRHILAGGQTGDGKSSVLVLQLADGRERHLISPALLDLLQEAVQ